LTHAQRKSHKKGERKEMGAEVQCVKTFRCFAYQRHEPRPRFLKEGGLVSKKPQGRVKSLGQFGIQWVGSVRVVRRRGSKIGPLKGGGGGGRVSDVVFKSCCLTQSVRKIHEKIIGGVRYARGGNWGREMDKEIPASTREQNIRQFLNTREQGKYTIGEEKWQKRGDS